MFHENIYFFIFKNGQLFFYVVLLNVFSVEGIENAKKISFFLFDQKHFINGNKCD